jgi:Outer membrane protein beta-barrel domain
MTGPFRHTAFGFRRRARCMWLTAACAAIGLPAQAQQFSIGLGAGLDRGKVDCVAGYACDHGSAHAKLFAGYRFADGIELQALLFDAGHFDGGDTSPLGTPFGGRFKVGGVGVAAGYRWSFAPSWSLKGQLGIASMRTEFDDAAPLAGDAKQTTTQPLLGLSVGYAIAPNWQVSLDYDETRFKVYTTRGSLRMLGVAAAYAF